MTFVGGALSLSSPKTQTTKQVTLVLAATEYTHTFPANTKHFQLWINQAAVVRIAAVLGATLVAGEYVELEGGGGMFSSDIEGTPSIHFQANKSGTIINLVSWA